MKTVQNPARPAVAKPAAQAPQAPIGKTGDDFLDSINQHPALPENMEGVSDEEAFDLIEQADNSQLSELTGAYWKPSGAGTYVFKFTGMTTVEFDGKEQEAVLLTDKNGINYTAAQAVLVSSLKKVTELPCFVKVICDGTKRKSSAGEYFNMQVLTFPGAANQKL